MRRHKTARTLILRMIAIKILNGLDILQFEFNPLWIGGVAAWSAALLLFADISRILKIQVSLILLAGTGLIVFAHRQTAPVDLDLLISSSTALMTMIASVGFLRLVKIPAIRHQSRVSGALRHRRREACILVWALCARHAADRSALVTSGGATIPGSLSQQQNTRIGAIFAEKVDLARAYYSGGVVPTIALHVPNQLKMQMRRPIAIARTGPDFCDLIARGNRFALCHMRQRCLIQVAVERMEYKAFEPMLQYDHRSIITVY